LEMTLLKHLQKQSDQQRYTKTFIDSLSRSLYTKKNYLYSLNNYCQWLGIADPNKLITKDLLTSTKAVNQVEDKIIEYITFLKNCNQSYNSINLRLAAITHFYTINRVNLNKTYISKFKPINKKVRNNDKAYTHKQIERLLDSAVTERDKVIVLLMASAGLRIGALPSLTIGNLSKVYPPGYPSGSHIYKIVVYDKEPEQYYTFTTFELAEAIDNYLEYRKRNGEELKPEAPLLRNHFDSNSKGAMAAAANEQKFMGHRSFHNTIHRMLVRAGLKVVRSWEKRELFEIMASHGLRKFCITQMKKAKVDFNDREVLVGHKQSRGLDVNYDRSTEEDRLQEYLKAVELLTISPENRLQKKVAEQEHTIKVELAESNRQVLELRKQIERIQNVVLKDQAQVRKIRASPDFKRKLQKG
jgi:integrase